MLIQMPVAPPPPPPPPPPAHSVTSTGVSTHKELSKCDHISELKSACQRLISYESLSSRPCHARYVYLEPQLQDGPKYVLCHVF